MRYRQETFQEEVNIEIHGRTKVTTTKLHKIVTEQEVYFDFEKRVAVVNNFDPIITCESFTVSFVRLPPSIEEIVASLLFSANVAEMFLYPSLLRAPFSPTFPVEKEPVPLGAGYAAPFLPLSYLKISDAAIPAYKSLDAILEETADVAGDEEVNVAEDEDENVNPSNIVAEEVERQNTLTARALRITAISDKYSRRVPPVAPDPDLEPDFTSPE